MTEIRVIGPADEVPEILQIIRDNIPNIIYEREYEPYEHGIIRVSFTVEEKLQMAVKGNLQDWAILEYCEQTRKTGDVMRYFSLTHDVAREMLDRLVNSGDLVRGLSDKTYFYLSRKEAVFCRDCDHWNEDEGVCLVRGAIFYTCGWFPRNSELACKKYSRKQEGCE